CQTPERSGLPSAVLGAGALRFGRPSGNLGTAGVGYDGHCAESDGESETAKVIKPVVPTPFFIANLIPTAGFIPLSTCCADPCRRCAERPGCFRYRCIR